MTSSKIHYVVSTSYHVSTNIQVEMVITFTSEVLLLVPFVCLSARLCKNSVHKTWWKSVAWVKEKVIKF